MNKAQRVVEAVRDVVNSDLVEAFRVNERDFLSAREREDAPETVITQREASMDDVAQIINRSMVQRDPSGKIVHMISPVVIPRDARSFGWIAATVFLVIVGLVPTTAARALSAVLPVEGLTNALFGPHYWALVLLYAGFNLWRNSYVSIPDGCKGLVTRYGKLEAVLEPGRTNLFDPWSRVAYIVNTTREYGYNVPVREAPTASQINAAVDLFLLFRIEEPSAFIFQLGGASGFEEKLRNVISEVTRELVFHTEAGRIYDLVGETSQGILERLNTQFTPAVRFVDANITHAEPSSKEYRINLAKPEMVRVAQEAYQYQGAFVFQKEQDQGTLNSELARKQEQLSAIRAEIATYQAQIDTALERETHRAEAVAQQLLRETESAARARAALLEAQALDIRAASTAAAPETLQYRYRRDVLDRLERIADRLPQLVLIGEDATERLDLLETARHMLGVQSETLFDDAAVRAIRERRAALIERIRAREAQIQAIAQHDDDPSPETSA